VPQLALSSRLIEEVLRLNDSPLDILDTCTMVAELPTAGKAELLQCCEFQICRPGHFVYKSGDDAKCLYMLRYGSVDLYEEGWRVDQLHDGACFGSECLRHPDPGEEWPEREAAVQVVTMSELLVVKAKDVERLRYEYRHEMGVAGETTAARSYMLEKQRTEKEVWARWTVTTPCTLSPAHYPPSPTHPPARTHTVHYLCTDPHPFSFYTHFFQMEIRLKNLKRSTMVSAQMGSGDHLSRSSSPTHGAASPHHPGGAFCSLAVTVPGAGRAGSPVRGIADANGNGDQPRRLSQSNLSRRHSTRTGSIDSSHGGVANELETLLQQRGGIPQLTKIGSSLDVYAAGGRNGAQSPGARRTIRSPKKEREAAKAFTEGKKMMRQKSLKDFGLISPPKARWVKKMSGSHGGEDTRVAWKDGKARGGHSPAGGERKGARVVVPSIVAAPNARTLGRSEPAAERDAANDGFANDTDGNDSNDASVLVCAEQPRKKVVISCAAWGEAQTDQPLP
jgi:hypothetical protein